ncbi:hypothetical protein PHLGIDRAFT_286198 [Phlebiopsis gigantea 11061_1 CR5-6]|uniref:Uncharacterized protein n=1 Tax=Phlebiopsis gigantea (strain 11061_1 CR5-6) TaxID=745531 RepID=A0A0C3S0P2_PHLG1|nr:hypothetical protein PHLGIDRAFT_286198 [Phlebiopsis gigantea 11061_1 CR5-6]
MCARPPGDRPAECVSPRLSHRSQIVVQQIGHDAGSDGPRNGADANLGSPRRGHAPESPANAGPAVIIGVQRRSLDSTTSGRHPRDAASPRPCAATTAAAPPRVAAPDAHTHTHQHSARQYRRAVQYPHPHAARADWGCTAFSHLSLSVNPT